MVAVAVGDGKMAEFNPEEYKQEHPDYLSREVVLTDASGKDTYMSRKEADARGIGKTGGDSYERFDNNTVYKMDDGSYLHADQLPSSVTLNKDTGKITITAPSKYMETEAFKSTFNTSVLEQASSLYKRNQDAKVVDIFDDSDEKKDITIPEFVEKYDKAIKSYIESAQEIESGRDKIRSGEVGFSNRNNIGDRLTEQDFITMSQSPFEADAKDDSLLSVPKQFYSFFDGVEDFDPINGTITKKSFQENVLNNAKFSDEDIDKWYDMTEAYFNDDSFDDTDEYARMTAFRNYILAKDPNSDFFTTLRHGAEGFWGGAGNAASETLLGLTGLFGAAWDFMLDIPAHAIGVVAPEVGQALDATSDLAFGNLRDWAWSGAEWRKKEGQKFQKHLEQLSSIGGAAYNVGTVGEAIAELVIPASKAGAVAKAAKEAKVLAKGEEKLSKMAGEMAEAEKVSAGADAVLAVATPEQGAELARLATNIERKASFYGNVADLTAQTITESVISDPVLMGQILTDQQKAGTIPGSEEDTYGYLLETAAWNLGGWGAFSLGAKAVGSFAKTVPGRYINAGLSKFNNNVAVKMGKLNSKVLQARYGEDYLNGGRSAAKNATRKQNVSIRMARENVAKTRIIGNLEGFEAELNTLKKVENSIDNIQRGGREFARSTTDIRINPRLGGAEEELRAAANKISQAEKRAGRIGRAKKFTQDSDGNTRIMSKDAANYIGSKQLLGVLAGIKAKKGFLSPSQEKGKELLEAMMERSSKAMGAESTALADDYLDIYRKWYGEFNTIRSRLGIIDAEAVKRANADGVWGENGELYARVQRVTDPNSKMVRADGRIVRDQDTSLDKYVWGSDRDFMDPEVARYSDMMNSGAKLYSGDYLEGMKSIPTAKAKQLYTPEEVARAEDIKKMRKSLGDRLKSATRGVFSSGAIRTGEAGARTLRLQKMRNEFVKQAGKASDAKLSLARASRKKVRTNISDRKAAVEAMPESQLDEIIPTNIDGRENIVFSNMRDDDEFKFFISEYLDKNTRKLVIDRMNAAAGKNYPARGAKTTFSTEYNEEEAVQRLMDVQEGRLPYSEYLNGQRGLMWQSFKASNQGTETFLLKDPEMYSQYSRRVTVSDNGTLYRQLYAEAGGKPTKAAFESAFDDVMEKGPESEYFYGFQEFDPDGSFSVLGFNRGNDSIDTILAMRDDVKSGLTSAQLPIIKEGDNILTAANYNKVMASDPSFAHQVKASYAANNKTIRDGKEATDAAIAAKRDKIIAEREGLLRSELDELKKIRTEGVTADDEANILRNIDEGIDEYLDEALADPDVKTLIDDVIAQSGTQDIEAAREYIILEEFLKDEQQVYKEARAASRGDFESTPEGKQAADLFDRMFMEKIQDRRNVARQRLADAGSPLVDMKSWMKEIRDLAKDIGDDLSTPGVITCYDEMGRPEIWEFDPVVADVYTYGLQYEDMGAFLKFLNETSKIFRLGTTGANITSMVNQTFRDFGNAWLTSGSFHLVRQSAANLESVLGYKIVGQLAAQEPEIYEQLLKRAKEQGRSVAEVAVERERAIGQQASSNATETALLKEVADAREVQKISKGEQSRISRGIDKVVDTLSRPNEARERYLRNMVYMDSLNQALKRGETLEMARTSARYAMNNATTNFSRQMVHFRKLQRTVPYLGAAINGTKSFWRMMSVDPVGIMTRLTGGFIFPTIAFTGMAISDPRTREQYMQLNEYEKDNNLIVNVNGTLMKIPIPQEINWMVRPWQHFVETLYDANRHDFWDLMLSDAVGVSPIELGGFFDLDQDALQDVTWWDRVENEAAQLMAQLLPPPAKAIYMVFTGKDPYTGKFIDTSYSYYDEDAGQVVTMDSSQSAFGQLVASMFGSSASVAASITSTLVGRTGLDVLDIITSAAQGGIGKGLSTLGERAISEAVKPISLADYDRTKQAWNSTISQLWDEKNAIIESDEYKKIEQALSMETDPQKRHSLISQRKDLLEPWQKKVGTAIQKLESNLGGTFDRYRLAAVLSLLNTSVSQGGLNAADRAVNRDNYFAGRNEAVQTMVDMGANIVGDSSLLGYMTRDSEGNTVIKYNTPLEILAAQNAWYKQADIAKATMEEKLERGSVNYKTEKKAVQQQIDSIYAKDKLTKNDYNQINAIELGWNARVMEAVAPYIERVGAEQAVNNEEIIEYLEDFIYVPSEFKKDKNGRYVTNKKLGKGSANDAYIKNYIRSIFKVNDTGYSGGRNYSGRKTLGEK